ncbi:MAG TPA: TonB-dependent receptor [Albitalea sp.]
MNKTLLAALLAAAFPLAAVADDVLALHDPAEGGQTPPTKSLGVVTVTGSRPTSLPTHIPTTTEGTTRAEIERTVNATDSEDALKYFPSLLVRKRYVGDYNHAILSSRASGTGNSARSAVYADGILLSNYLGNGVSGLSFPPRWGLVTPEEIERVDVMYGPFSAAYPGNSVGAVVDYVTRMPREFEAHASMGYVVQPFKLYNTDETFRAWQASASLGDRAGPWAWWVNVNRTDSEGQPLTFPTRLVSAGGTPAANAVPVTGAVLDRDNQNRPWFVLGTGTQYETRQDHLKVKVAYDITPALRASYVFGAWQNDADGNSASYLRDADGQPVFSGPVSIDGLGYAVSGADFVVTREKLLHTMHGLSLKSHTGGVWDWEAAASRYDYNRDDKRQNAAANALPGALSGGPGTLADGQDTGWRTYALRGTWRPAGVDGLHVVDFGYQQEDYRLSYITTRLGGNYLADQPGEVASNVQGRTRLQSLWAQDVWRLSERWKAVLGVRAEHWKAFGGLTDIALPPANGEAIRTTLAHPQRSENHVSPKFALSWQWRPETVLKASLGRAVRMPTVAELYGATSTTNSRFINDPDLKPERSWTAELSAEQELFDGALLRLTFFAEQTRDALYNQSIADPVAGGTVSRVQNVDRVDTTGLEAALAGRDVFARGLDLSASLTYADSKIEENAGFVRTPGDTIGKWQPNIPRWRATAVASYRFDERWTGTLAWRYSGRQFRTLNNEDVNGFTYMGVSRYSTVDLRAVYRVNEQWTAAFGIDNLNNDKYWNFHPYPQRSYALELKFDL